MDSIPSSKRLQFASENGPVEILSFPIKNGDFHWFSIVFCKRLPEGKIMMSIWTGDIPWKSSATIIPRHVPLRFIGPGTFNRRPP